MNYFVFRIWCATVTSTTAMTARTPKFIYIDLTPNTNTRINTWFRLSYEWTKKIKFIWFELEMPSFIKWRYLKSNKIIIFPLGSAHGYNNKTKTFPQNGWYTGTSSGFFFCWIVVCQNILIWWHFCACRCVCVCVCKLKCVTHFQVEN